MENIAAAVRLGKILNGDVHDNASGVSPRVVVTRCRTPTRISETEVMDVLLSPPETFSRLRPVQIRLRSREASACAALLPDEKSGRTVP